MKRPTYFISGRSTFLDILAAELSFAISGRYRWAKAFGITGPATSQNVRDVGRLEDCLRRGLHGENLTGVAEYIEDLRTDLDELYIDLAIFVGYSLLHMQLARYFKGRQVPVVFYGPSSSAETSMVSAEDIAECVDFHLGSVPNPGPLLSSANTSYHFVGYPCRDRIERVKITAEALGFDPSKPLVCFHLDADSSRVTECMSFLLALSQELRSKLADVQLVMTLRSALYQQCKDGVLVNRRLCSWEDQANDRRLRVGDLICFEEMGLELSFLAKVVVTGVGSSSVEAALLGRPFVAYYDGKKTADLMASANKLVSKEIGDEFPITDDPSAVAERIVELFHDDALWQQSKESLEDLRSILTGYAADNAAEYVGGLVGNWDPKKRLKGAGSL